MSAPSVSRRELIAVASAAAVGMALEDAAAATTQTMDEAPRLPAKILLRGQLDDAHLARVRDISPELTVGREVPLGEANVILGGIGADELSRASNLRWVQWLSAGVEHAPLEAMLERDIILTNAQGCYGPQIAEHVFALLLALTRGIGTCSRNRRWKFEGQPVELRGMTMGIIGLGGIGRETARRAKAMDMRVVAVDAEPFYAEKFAQVDQCRLVDEGLDELLKASDVVVVAAPLTPRTRGMLGTDQFGLMREGSYLINVARGKIVQTGPMLAALRSGRLAGVGLDVTDPEPLPPDHPLWQEDRAIVSSHIAGRSQLGYARVQEVFVQNVGRFAAGRAMLNVVDKGKGY